MSVPRRQWLFSFRTRVLRILAAQTATAPRRPWTFSLWTLLLLAAAVALPMAAFPAIERMLLIAWYEIACMLTFLAWRRQLRRLERASETNLPDPPRRPWLEGVFVVLLWFGVPAIIVEVCKTLRH